MKYQKEPEYLMKTEQYDVPFWDYYDREQTFGRFCEDGACYEITRRDTPRQWFQFLTNNTFGSLVTNCGEGFTAYGAFFRRVTKYDSETDYLVRHVNGLRKIFLTELETGKACDLFRESEDFLCRVYPGRIEYTGSWEDIRFQIQIFVPLKEPMECWQIRLENRGNQSRRYRLDFSQDWSFQNLQAEDRLPQKELSIVCSEGLITASCAANPPYKPLHGFFCCDGMEGRAEPYQETRRNGDRFHFTRAVLSGELELNAGETAERTVLSGASESGEKIWEGFDARSALSELESHWKTILVRNRCTLPDKNLEYFLNIWLKNQIHLTYRYNRFDLTGYRDVLQDSWGYMLLEPEKAKERILEALSKMYRDGRCPRQYDPMSDILDRRDFADSPIWCPIAVDSYLKETGDFDFLQQPVGYLDTEEVTTIEEHIWRSLDYLYHSRGENGLILMRGGDWLDGLGGLDKYGPATSTWLTIAAYHAQNIMTGIYRRVGENEKANCMEQRSVEYKEIVNRVSWDGQWYTYGFMGDGSPIGSHKNPEGKIYLNPQTWAIFTGIADEKEKIKKMRRAISIYLSSPYGPQLLYPPYVRYGEKMGRLQKQRPGTFANGAVYLHAASFKIFADIAVGEYDEALDTMRRILPNHPDNPDTHRTSEPYCVGNVHYGMSHSRSGMNLYSWFSATPSWLIHAGFEQLLGVKAEFDGVSVTPHLIDGFDSYRVIKQYRGSQYDIQFVRQEEKGVWVNGVKSESCLVKPCGKKIKVKVSF